MFIKIAISIIIILTLLGLLKTHYQNIRLAKSLQTPPSHEIYQLDHFFSPVIFNKISQKINRYYQEYNIRNDNIMRKGSSFSHHQMLKTPLKYINAVFDNVEVLAEIKKRTGLGLQYVPKTDPNRLGVLIYQKPQDGIDWHYDGNYYYGNRWVGIFTVKNRKLKTGQPSSARFNYILGGQEYSLNSQENSLLLFRGDQIKHKVTPLAKGEIRIVVSMLFCDICEKKVNPLNHLYQHMVNLSFYGKS